MEVASFVGAGALKFGQTRAEIRGMLPGTPRPFRKSADCEQLTDAYTSLGLHLYYDAEDRLEFIEAMEPAAITYRGVMLLGELAAVLAALESIDVVGTADDVGYQFDAEGFGLTVSEDVVEGVAVFPRGYYDT